MRSKVNDKAMARTSRWELRLAVARPLIVSKCGRVHRPKYLDDRLQEHFLTWMCATAFRWRAGIAKLVRHPIGFKHPVHFSACVERGAFPPVDTHRAQLELMFERQGRVPASDASEWARQVSHAAHHSGFITELVAQLLELGYMPTSAIAMSGDLVHQLQGPDTGRLTTRPGYRQLLEDMRYGNTVV